SLSLKQPQRALDLLTAADRADPDNAATRSSRIQALIALQRFAEGEALIAAHPDDPRTRALEIPLLRAWGAALMAARDFAPARVQFEKVRVLAPGDPDAHGDLGYLNLRWGDNREAEASLRRAVELAPADVRLILNLGSA